MIERGLADNPRGYTVFVASTVFLILAVVVFGLRLYTRLFIVRNTGRDDVCIALGLFFSLGLTTCIGIQVKNGLGRHEDQLSAEELENMLKAFWASLWLYYLALTFTKIGLILQYLRIFTQRWFRISAWSLFAIVVAYGFWTVFSSIFSCVPVESFWDMSVKGRCLGHGTQWYVNAGINIATDMAMVILPMPVIRKLQLPHQQRFALIAVFALGGFVCVVSMIRIKSLVTIAGSTDISYTNPSAAAWSSVEVSVGIICASLPPLKTAVVRFFPRLFSGRTSNGSRDQGTRFRNTDKRLTFGSTPTALERYRHSTIPDARLGKPVWQLRSHISVKRADSKDVAETEMGNLPGISSSDIGKNQINVVTVVEQAVETLRSPSPTVNPSSSTNSTRHGRRSAVDSDSDSEKGLCHPYMGGVYQDDFDQYGHDR